MAIPRYNHTRMPTVTRPDGATIAWDAEGEGPPVLVASQVFSDRRFVEPLMKELARDHTAIIYDARGTGESSAGGPYDLETDAADMAAVAEAAAEPVVVVGLGNSSDSAVIFAADRPDVAKAVVVAFGNPAGLRASRDSEALSGSDSVVEALLGMLEKDYRGALRTVIATGNPQMSEDEIRDRVNRQEAYCPAEVALARTTAWREAQVFEQARSLGDRLWILQHARNPWFPADLIEPTRELLPEAQIHPIEDGHISRPDLTADFVRRITAAED
jgi:pimeloyl-ACP methyl ester carboxylesterase